MKVNPILLTGVGLAALAILAILYFVFAGRASNNTRTNYTNTPAIGTASMNTSVPPASPATFSVPPTASPATFSVPPVQPDSAQLLTTITSGLYNLIGYNASPNTTITNPKRITFQQGSAVVNGLPYADMLDTCKRTCDTELANQHCVGFIHNYNSRPDVQECIFVSDLSGQSPSTGITLYKKI